MHRRGNSFWKLLTKKSKLHSFLFNCERWACNFASSLPWLCGRWQLHERQKRGSSVWVCVCDALNWKLCTHTWPIPHSISLSLSLSLFHLRCLSAAVALCLNCRSYLRDTRATLRFATLWLCQWRQQKFRSLLLLNNSALILLFLNRLLIKLKVTTCSMQHLKRENVAKPKGKLTQGNKKCGTKVEFVNSNRECRAKGKCAHMLYIIPYIYVPIWYACHTCPFVCLAA